VTAQVNKVLIDRLDYLKYSVKTTTQLQLVDFILISKKLGKAILNQVVNKYGLRRHLTGFFLF